MLPRRLLACAAAALLLVPACAEAPPDEEAASDEAALAECSARSEVVVWAPSGGANPLLDGLAKDERCTHVYVVVPLDVGDKTHFHATVKQEIDRVHARGANFHAVAEFHWSSWRKWVDEAPGRTWNGAGREFRARMDAAGFNLHYGFSDTWFIQELPSTLVSGRDGVTTDEVRANVSAAATGLYEGGKLPNKKGGAMRVGVGHDLEPSEVPNLQISKQRAEDLLLDDEFWSAMARTLRFWSDEVFVEPRHACVPGANVGARAKAVNDYAFRLVDLAEAGGSRVAPARAFLRKTYMPLMNGTYDRDVKDGYGETRVPLPAMEKFLPLEVYSAIAYERSRDSFVGTRIGFAWIPGADEAVRTRLGTSTATALNRGLARGAAFACSATGTLGDCECGVTGASLETAWSTFETW